MFQGYHCELGVSSFKRRIPLNYAYGSFNGKWNMILNAGDVVSLTLPSTLSSLDTPCHLYGLYNACAANPKVLQKYLFYWNRWDLWNFAGWDKMKMVWLIILIDWYDLFIVLIDCYDLFIVWLMSWLMVWWCGSSGKCMRNLETFSCTGNLLATGQIWTVGLHKPRGTVRPMTLWNRKMTSMQSSLFCYWANSFISIFKIYFLH